jgi:DNA primase catalytic core
MRIKNLDELKSKIRPYLEQYLEDCGVDISGTHFLCINNGHTDNKPSANIWMGGENFNCHGCEAAGDIFTAAYYLEGKPKEGREFIIDNILYLAKKYNVKYEVIEETKEEKEKILLFRIMELIVKYANTYLVRTNNKMAMDYLKDRGWDKIIDTCKLGYTPSGSLYKFLKDKNINDSIIKKLGIKVVHNGDKVLLPQVEGRIIIPFNNYYGKPIVFISRAIDEKLEPKYLFSGNSILCKKSERLFNLDIARNSKSIYIVESNATVLTLMAKGITNVVALSGKNLSCEQYELLIKTNIKEIILCLDNDDAGLKALNDIIYTYKSKNDLKVKIKELPRINNKEDKELKDPDDYIQKYGVNKFKNLPEVDLYEWALYKFLENIEDIEDEKAKKYKDILFNRIIIEEDFLLKEKKIKKLVEKTNFTQKTIVNDLERYEKDNNIIVSVKEVMNARQSLITDINLFEEKVWSRTGKLLGLDLGWDYMNKYLDGLQEGFFAIVGRTNIGKSALLLSMAYNLLLKNKDKVYVLYFSIDDSSYTGISRLISIRSRIPINDIKNPKYRIKYNKELEKEVIDKMLKDRDDAINYVKSLSDSFSFRSMTGLQSIISCIKLYNNIVYKEGKQLVVIIDKMHNIKNGNSNDRRMSLEAISTELKELTRELSITIVSSAEVTKSSVLNRPTEADVKETQKIEDDSDVMMMMYQDHKVKQDSLYVFEDDGKKYPITELTIPKSKLGTASGPDIKVFFRHYTDISYVEECSKDEQLKYKSI